MKAEGLKAQAGCCQRRPQPRGGKPSIVAPDCLEQWFDVAVPDACDPVSRR